MYWCGWTVYFLLNKRSQTSDSIHKHTLFYSHCFIVLCQYWIFYTLKVCGNPGSDKSFGAIFLTAFAHFVSLWHFHNSRDISNFIIVLSSMVKVIFDVTPTTCKRLRWWVIFSSNKIFLTKECTLFFFKHNAIAH